MDAPLLDVDVAAQVPVNRERSAKLLSKNIIDLDPAEVVHHLRTDGVRKLGELKVKDRTMAKALDGQIMITDGADTDDLDYVTFWKDRLSSYEDPHSDWSAEIRVAAYYVTIENAAATDVDGLLTPLLRRYNAQALSKQVFSLPAIQAVINFKWQWFAWRWLLTELVFFLIWLLSFNTFVVIEQDESTWCPGPTKDTPCSIGQLLGTYQGKIAVTCEILSLAAMVPFVIIEFATITTYGLGWVNLWNLLDVVTYINQVLITYLHLNRVYAYSELLTVCLVVQCVCIWFRAQYFSRVFKTTNCSFVDYLIEVFDDVKWYMFFTLLIFWGFGMGYYSLYRLEQEHSEAFNTLGSTILTTMRWGLNGVDMKVLKQSRSNTVATVLSLVFQFLSSWVLMKFILGVIAAGVGKVRSENDVVVMVSKASTIDELELAIPQWLEPVLGRRNPKYVHFLKVCSGDDESLLWTDKLVKFDQKKDKGGLKVTPTSNIEADIAELKQLVMQLHQHVAELTGKRVGGEEDGKSMW